MGNRRGWMVIGAAVLIAAAGLALTPRPQLFALGERALALAFSGSDQLALAVALGYGRSPEIIIGLGLALALPLIALAGLAVRFAMWLTHRVTARPAPIVVDLHHTSPHARAWVAFHAASVGGGGGQAGRSPLELKGELMRIGSGEDNDFAITGAAPLHALIRRTSDAEFVIVDVSASAGGGLMVNGRRLASCRLRNGDRIDLGAATLTFHRKKPAGAGAASLH